jgi:hypothetical protein
MSNTLIYAEKSDFGPPSWIDTLFLADIAKYVLICHVADRNTNSLSEASGLQSFN